MDEILRDCIEGACHWSRLGRIDGSIDDNSHFASVLAELEAEGDAMRYVTSQGNIAWRATPQLRDYLTDLRLDAESDFADEEI
jgi:alkylation response protein AidB-like acyl-CoA dehydrogenase